MASAPSFRESDSFESLGSGSLNADSSPPVVGSPCLVADSAAPVFPYDLSERSLGFGLSEHSSSSSTPRSLSTVKLDERHVFLCYKEPQSWPALVEAVEFDRLPRLLAAAIKSRKNEMAKKARLLICEGRDGTDSSNGDILIFPDMVRYRGLTHFDVDAFVEEVLVQNLEWLSGRPETLSGTHIFVCAHASHDAQCGLLGPIVIGRLKDEISARGLGTHVFVRPCSHGGVHKYSGNVIIYNSDTAGEVLCHCYGYVTPDHVPSLLDECFGKNSFADGQWRGCPGTMNAEPERTSQNSIHHNGGAYAYDTRESQYIEQQNNGHTNGKIDYHLDRGNEGRNSRRGEDNWGCPRWWQGSSWFDLWEREDTLAALAVAGAAASVAVAYHLYRIYIRN